MKKILILLVSIFLAGCDYMTNEEIIKQTNLCKENNMDIAVYRLTKTSKINYLQCIPRETLQ